MGELVLWCGMFAPKGHLEWYHGLARGAPSSHRFLSFPLSLSPPHATSQSIFLDSALCVDVVFLI